MLSAATAVLLSLIALVTGTLVARLLGPHGRGQLAAIQIWGILLYRVATIGLPDAIIFFTAGDRSRAGRYFSSAISLALMLALPVSAAAYVLLPHVLSAQTPRIVDAARLYVILFIPLFALVNLPIHSLRGSVRFFPWNVLLLVRQLGWAAVLVVGWMIPTYDPVHIAFFQIGSLVVLGGFNLWIVTRRLRGSLLPDHRLFRPLLRFGIPSALSDTSELLNLRVDQLLLAGLIAAEDLGFYAVAAAWSLAARPLLTSVGNVLFPRVASLETRGGRGTSFVIGTRSGVAVGLLMLLVLFPITPLGVPLLFGERFAPAVPAALILLVGGTLWGINTVIEEGARGLGNPGIVMRAELLGGGTTVLLVLVFTPSMGIVGAALGSMCGFAVTTALLAVQTARLVEVRTMSLLKPDFRRVYWALVTWIRSPTS